ncbi:unnamed protein product [Hyaloperonospora brassicae]|uniref:RxLR effector candidate protein n=1 Tax=Hyaloperonospora brassicae TaxID=162125 RepID=A0AAV0TDA7_HYABA|nr:unnamed protein product [Hyaloperonospora brassicae]CAI5723833.1 unnamed protein product [Hyaloperonospora brassicae]
MHMYCLLFLVFFVVNGVLTHVAAFDPSDALHSKATVTTTEDPSTTSDAAVNIRALKGWTGEERGPVFDSIFGPMKKAFEKLMGYIRSFLSRFRQEQAVKPTEDQTLVNKVMGPLLSDTHPEAVFHMLHSEEGRIYKWLESTALYRSNSGETGGFIEQTVLLLDQFFVTDEAILARVFAKLMMNHPEWKEFAEAVQRRHYKDLVVKYGVLPSQFERHLLPPGSPGRPDQSIVDLPKDDPIFRAYKAFILEFADAQGPDKREKLKSLFSLDDGAKAANYVTALERMVPDQIYQKHNLFSE